MTLQPKSPRVGRSPKLKAKWLSNTLAYQYGNNGTKKSEIIVLSNDLDQYLQDIFQSVDQKGRGKITSQEFKLLCDVLYLKDPKILSDLKSDMSFAEFHERLCEHFACYGDFTGFLVNQNFRTINVNNRDKEKTGPSSNNVAKRTEFQKKIVNNKNHTCVHDAELFRNWDKLRLSGFRLSEMKEHIDLMLYEVTFHKEESECLKEIIEDLRAMLQASDAQNIGMQVALKKYQQQLFSASDTILCKDSNRLSLPLEGTKITYKPLKGEEKSLRILARELTQLRELRDKEVSELISFNSQLQYDVTDLSREICRLEDENRQLTKQLESIVNTYQCCRQLFAVCVESFREVEANNGGTLSPTATLSPTLRDRSFSFKNTTSVNDTAIPPNEELEEQDNEMNNSVEELLPPEAVLIKRLEHEIIDQQELHNAKLQDISRLDKEVSVCRRHLQTANFQVEALETECSRLLAMEDQLVSVFRLLQKGRNQTTDELDLDQVNGRLNLLYTKQCDNLSINRIKHSLLYNIAHYIIMLTKIVVLVCVFICSLNMYLATNFKWRRVKSHDDSISNEDTLLTVDSVSMLQCSRNCLDVTGCVAFYYNKVTQLCQLQSNSSPDPAKRKQSTGTNFYVNTCMQYHYSYNAELRKYYQRHTFGISTHANATDTCKQNGGRLITLSRKTEFKAMQTILKSKPVAHISKEGFWVGAKVNTLTKKFEWDDGVKVKKGFWAPQQPDYDGVNTFTECVLMIPIFSYKLDDFNCTLASSFVVFPICECALI